MSAEILELEPPIPEEKASDENEVSAVAIPIEHAGSSLAVGEVEEDEKDTIILPEPVQNTAGAIATGAVVAANKKSGKGGGGWWLMPCSEHGNPRYTCCVGGKCQSWKLS